MSRRAALVFIHAFLLVQVALPLQYYLARRDRFDERFAWRMFSVERMAQCKPLFRVGDDPQPVQLGATFHEAWIGIANRGRRDVLDAMAARLCRDNPDKPVKLEMTCRTMKKVEKPSAGHWDLCRQRKS